MFHNPLLMLALSALVFQEPTNYQPLETMGDVVLKVVMAARLLGVSVWLEGNLTKRKRHTRLAKESVTRRLYTWLFEIGRLQNKWEPLYIATIASVPTEELSKLSCVTVEASPSQLYIRNPVRQPPYPPMKFSPRPIFQPGKAHLVYLLSSTIVRRSIDASVVSRGPQTVWYERKKFLGYEALDIVVTGFSYRARGKDDSPESNEYSPGYISKFAIAIQNLHITIVLRW
ncbi:hypothetical protein GYMLUDRAFT_247510 [Collybiopsis luxurians FD-317 M1]|uniref:RNase III domain-containing protein n=1 Tax=Collybiopsis luxurians FD-317 M1 TaxID=944289 RepID=A0A0D0CN87_9AGAR|nr:hypothetical protein GYMLUDRAFT_247510 [Collybiopsis luxurians FD-317 M1]